VIELNGDIKWIVNLYLVEDLSKTSVIIIDSELSSVIPRTDIGLFTNFLSNIWIFHADLKIF
jgi:hypothetical protein